MANEFLLGSEGHGEDLNLTLSNGQWWSKIVLEVTLYDNVAWSFSLIMKLTIYPAIRISMEMLM